METPQLLYALLESEVAMAVHLGSSQAGVRIAARRIETWCKGERGDAWCYQLEALWLGDVGVRGLIITYSYMNYTENIRLLHCNLLSYLNWEPNLN